MLLSLCALLAANSPLADQDFYHPYYVAPKGPKTIDLGALEPIERAPESARIRFEELDALRVDPALQAPPPATRTDGGSMPAGWVQRGNGAYPADVANGLRQVDPIPPAAFEDIPGNKYPRKHTLYLNFVGAPLENTFGGNDNSAENISVLANGDYPAFTGGNALATAIAQAVEADLAPYGVRVLYLDRPSPVIPYTMEMVAGDYTDTTLDMPAGGVAPTADCSALNQRHVVFTFAEGSNSASLLANTASQEAGHAWGLDHTLNCDSVMSYCGGFGAQSFSTTCDSLCEAQCQGPNSIGCRLNHETFCGEDSDAQNEEMELTFLFGGNEPDMEPPQCDILSPADGDTFDVGADVSLRVDVDDNYGGMGWQITILKDGEALYDEIDYFKETIDTDFNAALNLQALEAGVYEITALCMDHADQVTEQVVTFTVGDAEPMGSTGGGESTGEPPTSGTTASPLDDSDDDTDDEEDTSSGVPEMVDSEKGCGCHSRGSSGSVWLAFFVVAYATRRRRGV